MTEDRSTRRTPLFPPGTEQVALYRNPDLLASYRARCRELGWLVLDLDAGSWADPDRLHDAVSAAFDLPEHYGRNLDAFHDSLSDWVLRPSPPADAAAGCLIVLDHYDRFAAADRGRATLVLDVFVAASVLGLQHRWPLAVAIVSADPELRFPPTAPVRIDWNRAERRRANRAE